MIMFTLNYAKNHLTNDKEIVDIDFDKSNMDERRGNVKGDLPDDAKGDFAGGMKGDIDRDELPEKGENGFGKGNIENSSKGDFKIDGGFGGGGEISTQEEIMLTTPYILFIGFWCLVFSCSFTYFIMSNTIKTSITNDKILIYLLSNVIFVVLFTLAIVYFGNNYYLNSSVSKIEYSSPDDLHIDMKNWSYDEQNNVYYQIGLVYVSNPSDVEYESLGIYVPGDYLDCTKGTNNKYTCSLNTQNKIGDYTSQTAPIVMPMNTGGYAAQAAPVSYSYSGLEEYLDAGFIYVYSGCRGKNNGDDYDGGAPWPVTDFKAAIRYLRYNKESLPGDTESIFVFGMSGGGGQSTIVGTSGDSELYTPYLESIGALMTDDAGIEISDAVAGIMAWCPITSLDFASEAYEWNMGQYMPVDTRDSFTWTSALSKDMASAYADYINALQLVDESGQTLKLTSSKNGIHTSGSYYNYLLSVIEESLNHYLSDTYDDVTEMQKYVDSLNSDTTWVTFNKKNKTVSISSIEDFVTHCKKATKSVGAFDDLNRIQAENYVFGNSENDNLHFDYTMAKLLLENANTYAKYSDYDAKYADAYNTDIKNVDALGNTSIYRQNMYNPMYYLSNYYDGYETANVAKYWRIRTGITQGDTALTVETNLALALNQYKTVSSVDFATVWNQGHTMAERTENSTSNFISWVHSCLNS